MWIYMSREAVENYNETAPQRIYSQPIASCFVIDADYQPSIVEVGQSDLGFEFTDDIFKDYAK